MYKSHFRASLVVQWLGGLPAGAEDTGSSPGQGTKIPQAAWCGKKKKKKKKHYLI